MRDVIKIMNKFTFHRIVFTVKDIPKSIRWYQSKLGFRVIERYRKGEAEIVHLTRDGVRIELFHYNDGTSPLPDYRKELSSDLRVIGTKHLCIEVDTFDEMLENLKEKGVEVLKDPTVAGFGGRYAFIKDCNGILIEFYEMKNKPKI